MWIFFFSEICDKESENVGKAVMNSVTSSCVCEFACVCTNAWLCVWMSVRVSKRRSWRLWQNRWEFSFPHRSSLTCSSDTLHRISFYMRPLAVILHCFCKIASLTIPGVCVCVLVVCSSVQTHHAGSVFRRRLPSISCFFLCWSSTKSKSRRGWSAWGNVSFVCLMHSKVMDNLPFM